MSDSTPKRDVLPDDTAPEAYDRPTTARGEEHTGNPGTEPFERRDERTNPHGEAGAPETAARTGGLMAGMFFPVVIVAVIALIVILFFVL